jgi:uncharacterized protein YjbI with pentapeptide repeats
MVNANVQGAILDLAQLDSADLSGADFSHASLSYVWEAHVDFRGANLSGASLSRARLQHSDLRHTNLTGAKLSLADLRDVSLDKACLKGTNLMDATLKRVSVNDAQFHDAFMNNTAFIDVDLSMALGLDKCRHGGPSALDHLTLAKSRKLPITFLQGCGLGNWEIEAARLYNSELTQHELSDIPRRIRDLREQGSVQRHNVFISYAHEDAPFVDALETKLNAAGIRFWRDVHDAVSGRLDRNVEHGMRANPVVVVVLSRESVRSAWVEHELSLATRLSRELSRDVLCPIALDDSWKTSDWSGPLQTQIKKYNVLDFSRWKESPEFAGLFQKLLAGLDLFYH